MGKKRTPQTAKAYAEYLYCLADAHPGERIATYKERDIVDCRVRAFVDGVKWEHRRQLKIKREQARRVSKLIYATTSG